MAPSSEYLDFIGQYPPLSAIGNTPLVEIDLDWDIGDAEIHAKFEHLNPGGSLKDRPVLKMLVEAILAGDLTKDITILDATSGNAGIAYAMIGAVLGYRVELVMPENASEERKKRLLAHGANIVYTDPMLGYDETLYEVKRRYEANPDKYFYCDQYSNLNNPQAHYETTGEEILKQAPNITHFVAGVGTGGTISGVGRRLKEFNSDIQVVGINPPELTRCFPLMLMKRSIFPGVCPLWDCSRDNHPALTCWEPTKSHNKPVRGKSLQSSTTSGSAISAPECGAKFPRVCVFREPVPAQTKRPSF